MTSLMHVGSIEALAASDASLTQPGPDIYFEGPEKKLEVFFSAMPSVEMYYNNSEFDFTNFLLRNLLRPRR